MSEPTTTSTGPNLEADLKKLQSDIDYNFGHIKLLKQALWARDEYKVPSERPSEDHDVLGYMGRVAITLVVLEKAHSRGDKPKSLETLVKKTCMRGLRSSRLFSHLITIYGTVVLQLDNTQLRRTAKAIIGAVFKDNPRRLDGVKRVMIKMGLLDANGDLL